MMKSNIVAIQKQGRKVLSYKNWEEILNGFIEILHINISIIDENNNLILPPLKNKFGERLLTDNSLGFDLLINTAHVMEHFKPHGFFFEAANRFDLRSFALPIDINDYTIGYVLIGPVILNKPLDMTQCQKRAKNYGITHTRFINELSELRVVSNIMMNSILNILRAEIHNMTELNLRHLKEEELQAEGTTTLPASANCHRIALAPVDRAQNADNLASLILSLAMNITDTECGSFMVLDTKKENLRLSAFRGLNEERIKGAFTPIGQGISGIAAQEDKTYHIKGQKGPNNRLRHLLQRPEIKQSLVMPIKIQNALFGVLNLHTKKDDSQLMKSMENLKDISKLLSAI